MIYHSLADALAYRHFCPYCKQTLSVDIPTQNIPVSSVKNELSYVLYRLAGTDYLIINLADDSISIQTDDKTQGTFFGALRIHCPDCQGYYHTFNVKIDMTNKKLSEVTLNVHYITLKTETYSYELRSSISIDSTWLRRRGLQDQMLLELTFPFIEIDIEKPMLTVQKLEKLSNYL